MSTRCPLPVAAVLSKASGAMYGGEPATRCFPFTSNSGKTRPKSIRTTRCAGVSMMLSGLMSR